MDDRPRDSERASPTQRPSSQLTPPGNLPTADDDLGNGAHDDLHLVNVTDDSDYSDWCSSDSFDVLTGEEVADALRRDAKLRHELSQDGFEGPNWNAFRDRLIRYGVVVVESWLQTHKMWKECRKKGRYPGPPPVSWEGKEDDRRGLAYETVMWALIRFRDEGMRQERWKPEHGACLQTYFIGACVLVFPNVYRRWRREQPPEMEVLDDETVESCVGAVLQDPEGIAVSHVWFQEYLKSIPDERTRQAVLLRYMGYQIDEIAELLQTTPKSIERCLSRQRKRDLKLRCGRGECYE